MRDIILPLEKYNAVFTETGSLVSILDRETGRVCLGSSRPQPFFEIAAQELQRRSPSRCYGEGDFRLTVREQLDRAVIWTGRTGDDAIAVEFEARVQRGGIMRLRLIVENRASIPVSCVRFPSLHGISLGQSQRVTIPYSTGYSLDPTRLHDGEHIVLNYPVHASMQWIEAYTPDTGLYVGVHDDTCLLKRFEVSRDQAGLAIAWDFPDCFIAQGERLELPPIVMALHSDDWHAGARIYSDWASHVFRFPDPPEWIARRPAWAWLGMKNQHASRVSRTFAELPQAAAELSEHGIPVPHLSGYMEHGHDTHYPDYIAGTAQGGEDALVAAIQAVHDNNNRLALYANGRLIDPAGSYGSTRDWTSHIVELAPCAKQSVFDRSGTFTDSAVWDPEGRFAKEQYNNVTFAIGCPSDSAWTNTLADRLVYLVEKYTADGIYIDQICGCSSLPCYSATHGHSKPNLAWGGYLQFLRELRERIRRINPNAYLATEGMTDVFGQFFDIQQAHNDWGHQVLNRADPLPELFRSTFPECLVAMGPTSPGEEKYLLMAHGMMAGYDLFPVFNNNSTPEWRALLGSLLDCRESLWPRLRHSRKPLRVQADPDCYYVSASAGSGGILVNGGLKLPQSDCPTTDAVEITVTGGAPVTSGSIWLDGSREPLKFTSAGNTLRFLIPLVKAFSATFDV